jgi:hypothetical protein
MEMPYREPEFKALPPTALQLFQAFVPEPLVNRWVDYTNKAAEIANLKDWRPVSASEIYLWLAILIYMGIHKESSFRDYWKAPTAQGYDPTHPITKLMPNRRFQQLRTRLRICPLSYTTEHTHDAYGCIDEWSAHLQIASLSLYIPGTNIAVDEKIVAFTGKSRLTLTITTKPTPTGFKVWVIAQQGYFLGWVCHRPGDKYGPAGKPPRAPRGTKRLALNPTQSVVPFLIHKLPDASYHVFLDNLFSSPRLFTALREEGHGATGTARVNCGIFKQLVEAKIRHNKGQCWQWNELRAYATVDNKVSYLLSIFLGNPLLTCSKVNQIGWKDNALVLLLSTVFTGKEFEHCIRRRPTSKGPIAKPVREAFGSDAVKEMSIPSVTVAYNHNMGAVDIGDQLQATESLHHRVYKGRWQALAWTFLLDTVLVNSYLLQLHVWGRSDSACEPSRTQRDWRHRLINEICQAYGQTGKSRAKYRSGDTSTPVEAHEFVYRKKNSACVACQGNRYDELRLKTPFSSGRGQRRSQQPLGEVSGNSLKKAPRVGSRWGCKQCDVSLCHSDKCWYFYHRLD